MLSIPQLDFVDPNSLGDGFWVFFDWRVSVFVYSKEVGLRGRVLTPGRDFILSERLQIGLCTTLGHPYVLNNVFTVTAGSQFFLFLGELEKQALYLCDDLVSVFLRF